MYTEKKGIAATAVVAVVVVIALIGGGLYYYVSTSSPVTTTTSSQSTSTATSSTSSTSPATSSSTTSHTTSQTGPASSSSTSSASTSTSSTSTGSSTSTSVCSTTPTYTSTATTSASYPTGLQAQNFGPLLGNFSAMTINYFGSSGSSTFNLTSSYVILSKSGGTYDVNVTESTSEGGTASGQSVTATVLSNGTATAITFAGQTLTGLQANALFSGFMAPFAAELSSYSQLGLFTGLGNFHEAGTSQVTLGPTTMTVTNYAANSLPTTISTCEGTFTLTSYSFQTGKVPGTSITLVTLQSFKGSTVSPSYSGSIDYTLRVLSITKA